MRQLGSVLGALRKRRGAVHDGWRQGLEGARKVVTGVADDSVVQQVVDNVEQMQGLTPR
jgi:hypothetical protein